MEATPVQRLEMLFGELSELAGQRNAIDGRIVEIVAEMDRDELCGATGARSVAALVAWKLGSSSANAHAISAVARRLEAFPLCAQGMREGRLSLDQVGVIAEEENHHPAIVTEWGRVTVSWWTHKIGGLHANDFIMAAKTDQIIAHASS